MTLLSDSRRVVALAKQLSAAVAELEAENERLTKALEAERAKSIRYYKRWWELSRKVKDAAE